MSTNNTVLKGGLDSANSESDANGTSIFSGVAEKRRQLDLDKARKSSFLNLDEDELPEIAEEEDDPEQQLIDLIDEYANEAYKWVLVQSAKKHEYEYKIAESGDDYGRKKVKNGLELRQALAKFDEKLARVLQFCPDDRKECREFHDAEFAEIVCHRVRVMARLAVLVDKLLFSESKDAFEKVVQDAKENSKSVFVAKSDGSIQAFRKRYDIEPTAFAGFEDATFVGYYDFAVEQLSNAIGERSHELAKAHKEEVSELKREQESDESRISAKDLLLGGAEETNEKTTLLSWKYGYGHYDNTILVRRRDKALIVESVTGASEKDFRELTALNAEHGIKGIMVMLYNIVSADQLLPRQEDGKYRFNINVPMSIAGKNEDETAKLKKAWWNLALKLTLWVRTAAEASVPREMNPNNEVVKRPSASNGNNGHSNGFKPAIPLVDSDGKEIVEPEIFWFRKVNGGAGTITIVFPEGSSLHFLEAADEQMEIVLPERDVKFAKKAKIRVRRAIVQGRPKVTVDDCDNLEIFEELRVNGLIKSEWPELPNWNEMQVPWPNILKFGYKQACLTGQIKPNKSRE